jgi:ankyrin repeat protein
MDAWHRKQLEMAANGFSCEIVDIAEDGKVEDGRGGWRHGRRLTEDYAFQSHGIHGAAMGGQLRILEIELQDRNADPNEPNSQGKYALLMAAQAGQNQCIEMLMQYGATLDIVDTIKGWNAAHCAVAGKKHNTLQLLYHLGLDLGSRDVSGAVPAHLAARFNDLV